MHVCDTHGIPFVHSADDAHSCAVGSGLSGGHDPPVGVWQEVCPSSDDPGGMRSPQQTSPGFAQSLACLQPNDAVIGGHVALCGMHVPVAEIVTQQVLVWRSQGVVPQSRAAPASTGATPASSAGRGRGDATSSAPTSSAKRGLAPSEADASHAAAPGQLVTISTRPPQPATPLEAKKATKPTKPTIRTLVPPMRCIVAWSRWSRTTPIRPHPRFRSHRSLRGPLLSPHEFLYAPRNERGGGEGLITLYRHFSVPILVGAVGGWVAGPAGGSVAFVGGVVYAVWAWRTRKDAGGAILRIENDALHVEILGPHPLHECIGLGDLADVTLDLKAIERVGDGDSAIPAMRLIDSKVGPKIDNARIILVTTGGRELKLTEAFLPHFDAADSLGKMRVF